MICEKSGRGRLKARPRKARQRVRQKLQRHVVTRAIMVSQRTPGAVI